MIYDFDTQLHFSRSKEGKLDKIYRHYFKKMTSIQRIDRINDMTRQRAGIDRIITLDSGETVRTEEKWRTIEFTGDILIEYCSVYRNDICEKPGWIYTIDADYIFVVYPASQLVKVYPVVQLKLAWAYNFEQWIKLYKLRPVYNNGYVTLNVAVPCDLLERELNKVMLFEYQQTLF